jgi:hypothetical protein
MLMIPTKTVPREVVAVVAAAAVTCAGCGGHVRHTMQPNPSAHENWAAVMRLRIGATFLRVEDSSGAWTVGDLVAKDPEGITVGSIGQKRISRSQIRRVWIRHAHGDWYGIKEVVGGAVVGGLLGGLAVSKHKVIAGTVLAVAGAFTGLVLAVMTMFHDEKANTLPQVDEVLVYYSDRVAASPAVRMFAHVMI